MLDYIGPFVKPGVTTGELDRLCHEYMRRCPGHDAGAAELCAARLPALPQGDLHFGQPLVCHGIPGDKVLKAGDVVNIDVTVIKDGYHGDTSRMFFVGEPSIAGPTPVRGHLRLHVARHRAGPSGRHLGDIGHAIQPTPRTHGYSVVREFCGHGIGREFHEEPQVLHYGTPGHGSKSW